MGVCSNVSSSLKQSGPMRTVELPFLNAEINIRFWLIRRLKDVGGVSTGTDHSEGSKRSCAPISSLLIALRPAPACLHLKDKGRWGWGFTAMPPCDDFLFIELKN